MVVVDEAGNDLATLKAANGHIELRIIARRGSEQCDALVFAGRDEPGMVAAGVELWANGEAVSGESVVIASGEVSCHRFSAL